jgi:riboflavin biosynthesis pyrimidine reductase
MAELKGAGAEVYLCPGDSAQVDLGALLKELGRREINEVLLETGPTLAGAAVSAGLVDEILIYLAPHLMGDGGAVCSACPDSIGCAIASRLRFPTCAPSAEIFASPLARTPTGSARRSG